MDLINSNTISAFVPMLLTLVMFLLLAILYNVRCSRLARIHELQNKQHKEKEPEEHDERFATGKHFLSEVDPFYYCFYHCFYTEGINYRHLLLSCLDPAD